MAIDFTSATGNLFNRLGRIGYVLDLLNAWLGGSSADNLPTEMEDILEQYDAETPVIRAIVNSLQTTYASTQAAGLTLAQALQTAAQNTLIEMADADNPLESRSVSAALDEVIAQMTSGSDDVDASTAALTVTAGASNNGDAPVVFGIVNGKGQNLENAYAESIMIRCTSNATEGAETGTAKGEAAAASSKLSYDWPTGSGGSQTWTTKDPGSNGFLTNGDFDDFTANDPDNWTIDVGVAGAEILSTATSYRGGNALHFNDGAGAPEISQVLTGLSSRTNYAVSVWVRRESGVIAAGNLIIELYTGAAVINDDFGTANTLTIPLNPLTTSYVNYSAVFRLPDPVPAVVEMRVRSSTALGSGEGFFIDDLIMTDAMTQLYSGGPYFAVIRGATAMGIDDVWTVAVTNDRAGQFQTLFDKLFNLSEKLLPSDTGGAETIADTLIG